VLKVSEPDQFVTVESEVAASPPVRLDDASDHPAAGSPDRALL
jgi:hypothetical protein